MCNAKTDSPSVINHHIQDNSQALVSCHVYANITLYIDYILKSSNILHNAPVMYEDLFPYCTYYSCILDSNLTEDELLRLIETYEDQFLDTTDQSKRDEINAVLEELTSLLKENAPDYPEVYEWYIVSHYLANKLKEQGQVVINGNLWGRQTTGQRIYLDNCITDIVATSL